MKISKLVVIGLITWGVLSAAIAKLPITYLRDLVSSADWIVIGQVVAIEEGSISKEYGVPAEIAKILPLKLIKGVEKAELALASFHQLRMGHTSN